jgi:hypothetical protein
MATEPITPDPPAQPSRPAEPATPPPEVTPPVPDVDRPDPIAYPPPNTG